MQSLIRKQLLEAFSEAEGNFVSGQIISDLLGCSRTAVWKHIEDLRKEGYELEAVRRKGYRILSKPDSISGDAVAIGLKTRYMGRQIVHEQSAGSTQKIAHSFAAEGAPEGTVVFAEEQTEGRGRMSRSWHSPKGTGIWMSMILRPSIPVNKTPQLTLLTAVAIVQAIEEVTGLHPVIKWPNDIMMNGKKLVGILTELQAEADGVHSVIIGCGINVNQQINDFPEELRNIATSVMIEKKESINRALLIQHILFRFEELYEQYLQHGFSPVKLLWEAYAISLNRQIIARTLHGSVKGKAVGIDDDGVLLVHTYDGRIEKIYSADIEIDC
ncbi:biotin--[acetyl-CoA-carboxylase] ligase [Bacillus lacus]|uniref:Bifunctional ligase/repressor BirA n=1 Tax=Metabacillus lacus TaxID=1983721 RepID=A0A7X2LX69_9BACI|nr:biotin--[acetyl-CoA-carboxylase] ligase [Metabacillus lacus]MRX70971.1 biotin--[acetyl-CoA-carboxylase] ligase [Metabacillus lacus]